MTNLLPFKINVHENPTVNLSALCNSCAKIACRPNIQLPTNPPTGFIPSQIIRFYEKLRDLTRNQSETIPNLTVTTTSIFLNTAIAIWVACIRHGQLTQWPKNWRGTAAITTKLKTNTSPTLCNSFHNQTPYIIRNNHSQKSPFYARHWIQCYRAFIKVVGIPAPYNYFH